MKLKRYQIITFLLVCYALFMTIYFGLDLLREGNAFRFYATAIAEFTVITLAFFALRKRDRQRQQRKMEKN